MDSKCFPIEMLRLCSISTSQMDTENTEHVGVKIQFQLQCIITIPLWRIERYKIAPVSQIPDPVPTGQLAEGAAKNLLPPRGGGGRRGGMPSSKSMGERWLPSQEAKDHFLRKWRVTSVFSLLSVGEKTT